MALLVSEMTIIDGKGCCPVLSLNLWNDEFAVIGAEDSSSLTDAGRTNMFRNSIARIWNFDSGKFLGSIEHYFFIIFVFKHCTKILVLFYIDSTIAVRTRKNTSFCKSLIDFVINGYIILWVMCQAKAYSSYHWHEMKFEHTIRCRAIVWRYDYQQLVFSRICFANVIDNGHVVWLG